MFIIESMILSDVFICITIDIFLFLSCTYNKYIDDTSDIKIGDTLLNQYDQILYLYIFLNACMWLSICIQEIYTTALVRPSDIRKYRTQQIQKPHSFIIESVILFAIICITINILIYFSCT